MAGRSAGRGQPRVPPPPSEFAKCKPSHLASYPQRWIRLAAIARANTHDWDDRAVSRFSHPDNPFKILYLADSRETAFWEVFGEEIDDMPVDERALSIKAHLQPREWINFELPRGLRLIDVTREETLHALRANAGTWLAPYRHCQKWAEALMNHPSKLDGFIYQACRRGETARCLALFARPDERTMEELVFANRLPGRPPIHTDPETLKLLIRYKIDMR